VHFYNRTVTCVLVCFVEQSVLLRAALHVSTCMSALHVRTACQHCMSAPACQHCMSGLHVSMCMSAPACQHCMSGLHVSMCMSALHVSMCMSGLHVSTCMSGLHVGTCTSALHVSTYMSACTCQHVQQITLHVCRDTVILRVILYRCETWSLNLREERMLRVFENRVLRRIFGPSWDEVTG